MVQHQKHEKNKYDPEPPGWTRYMDPVSQQTYLCCEASGKWHWEETSVEMNRVQGMHFPVEHAHVGILAMNANGKTEKDAMKNELRMAQVVILAHAGATSPH